MSKHHGIERSPLLRRPADRLQAAPPPEFRAPTSYNDKPAPNSAAGEPASARLGSVAPQSPFIRQRDRARIESIPPREAPSAKQSNAEPCPSVVSDVTPPHSSYWAAAAITSGLLFLWLYGPTIVNLINTWRGSPDYFHAFLVLPFAGWLLWHRRTLLPACGRIPDWSGLVLVLMALGMRYAANRSLQPSLAGSSVVFWLAGSCWLLAGFRAMVWAFPALILLFFLLPLPSQFEQLFNAPVQTFVATTSATFLVCLGRPAIAEGSSLYLGESSLDVAGVCSGLGTFYGITAIAMVFAALRGRGAFEKLAFVAAIIPIGILAAVTRVAALAMMSPSEPADVEEFVPSRFGWLSLCVAVALFSLLTVYLRRLLIEVELETGQRMLKRPLAP